jgi:hypothetical protein
MPDVNVNFMHPTDGRVITVTVDDTMTAHEIISELLANNFVSPAPGGYELVENGNCFRADQTLADAGVRNGSKIRVNPSTDAGGHAGEER